MAEQIRVLIEHENPRALARQADALTAAGFRVETCPGPSQFPDRRCPLVAGDGCAHVADADLIVNELPLGDIDVFVAQRRFDPDTPVQLALSERQKAVVPMLSHVADVVPRALSPQELVAVVRRAYDDFYGRPPGA